MRWFAVVVAVLAVTPEAGAQARFELAEVQGTLAIEGLDGWLLYDDGGSNPLAQDLVNPTPRPSHPWFYFVPSKGRPMALCQQSDAASFGDALVRPYGDDESMDQQLAGMLRGLRAVAMEYEPQTKLAAVNRVPAEVVERVRKSGASVASSAPLVQFTVSLWRRDGRVTHYVAAHHLHHLYLEALAYMEGELVAGRPVSETAVVEEIRRGYAVRGVAASEIVVASGANTADPRYRTTLGSSRGIVKGDVVRITLAGRLVGHKRAIAANLSWTAYVGSAVPADVESAFAAVVLAREAVLDLLKTRQSKRLPVLGYEADDVARLAIADAEFAANVVHRTGHSLDTSIHGAGANLDSAAERDSRPLVRGSGFTVEPGLYVAGQFGVQTEINVFLGVDGVEVTSPAQDAVSLVRVP